MSNAEQNMRPKNANMNFYGVALNEMAVATVSGAAGGWYKITAGLTQRNSFIIANSGAATVYVGATGAVELNGIPVATGDKLAIDASAEIEFYVFSATSAVFTSVMELN